MAKEKYFQVGVKALIENDKKQILLLYTGSRPHYYNSNYWDIPGGRIEEGQSAEEALRREIEEEIGVSEIDSIEFLAGVLSNHEFEQDGIKFGLVLMVYKTKLPAKSKIIISPEHDDFEWVDSPEAAKRLASKYPPEFTSLL